MQNSCVRILMASAVIFISLDSVAAAPAPSYADRPLGARPQEPAASSALNADRTVGAGPKPFTT